MVLWHLSEVSLGIGVSCMPNFSDQFFFPACITLLISLSALKFKLTWAAHSYQNYNILKTERCTCCFRKARNLPTQHHMQFVGTSGRMRKRTGMMRKREKKLSHKMQKTSNLIQSILLVSQDPKRIHIQIQTRVSTVSWFLSSCFFALAMVI